MASRLKSRPSCSVIPYRSRSTIPTTRDTKRGSSLLDYQKRSARWWWCILQDKMVCASSALEPRRETRGEHMKRTTSKAVKRVRIRREYDFSAGVRGKYAEQYRSGTNLVV